MSQLFQTGVVVSKGNSTNVPLLANAIFIGSTDDVTSYQEIDINVAGSPYNSPGSLYFEFSPDGVNWDVSILVGGEEYYGPNIVPQHLRVVLPYFRVRYINGHIDQIQFRLTVVYHRSNGARLTRYLNQQIDDTEGVENVRAFLAGSRTDGYYANLAMNTSNLLLIDGSTVIQPVSGTVIANQGTPTILSSAWPTMITDGTNTVGITNVLGNYGLKVDVIKTVASGGAGSGGTSSNFADPFPVAGTATGWSDGYYMQNARVFDLDTSLSTEYVIGTNLRTFNNGGSIEAGTNSHPLRIDPTGDTIQPISGTVAVSNFPSSIIVSTVDGYVQTNPVIQGTVTANQGLPNILSEAWPVEITDGTNVLGTVSHPLQTNIDGYVQTNPNVIVSGTVAVSNFPASIIVSAVDGYVQTNPVVVQGTSPWIVEDSAAETSLSTIATNQTSGSQKTQVTNFPATQPVSGTITTNQGTNPWIVQDTVADGYLSTLVSNQTNGSSKITIADSANLDAFSRLRVSTPIGLFYSKLLNDNQPLIYDDQQTSGGSTSSTYNTNQASVTLKVTGNVAGQRVRQSFIRPAYQPGRSQLVTMTGILGEVSANASGITCRIGQFDGYNGFYFQYGGAPGTGIISVGYRTFTSGSVVDTQIAQSLWNIDQMNGSGPSEVTINSADVQIFIIDYQWLGVGRIRYGFDINGIIYYCHQVLIANTQAVVSVSTPNNPIRYEITSAGTGTSAIASMLQICAAVASEGGDQVVGFPFSVSTAATATLTTGATTSAYPLIALQLQTGKTSANIALQTFSAYSSTANAIMLVQLYLNPTITGTALSYSTLTNSSIQYALGTNATTISGGTIVYQEYINVGKLTNTTVLGIAANLGSFISGTGETLVMSIISVAGTAIAAFGSITWLENT